MRCFAGNLTRQVAVAGALILTAGAPLAMRAQDAAAASKTAYNKVIGAVVSVAPDGSSMSVKPDAGPATEVPLDANTSFMLVPPGEKDLRKATRVELKDIQPGDRVYARSRKVEGQDHTPASSVFVMSKSEVAQHQEKTAGEWQRRGAAGKVTAVDAAAKTITVATHSGGSMVVETGGNTVFRRYAPDSVKFADAQPSAFSAVAVGDNVRVLGDKDADGTKIKAEELVSGSFRNLAGTVISVDAAAKEIKVMDLLTKKPVTVKVNEDTNLRMLSNETAAMIARARARATGAEGVPGAAATGAGAAQDKGQGGPGSHPGFNGPAVPPAGATAKANTTAPGASASAGHESWQAGDGATAGAGGHMGGGRMDMNQALERAPKLELGELKPGAALIISSTNGADPSRVTAIAVVAGVEPILTSGSLRSSRGSSGAGESWTLDMAMPE